MQNKTTEIEQIETVQLTPEEKTAIRHRLNTRPGESEVLLSGLQFVSKKILLWYEEEENGKVETFPICLSIYSYREKRWQGENDYLNRESFFALCKFDGRLWKCKNFKDVAFLIKALRKDLKIRYTDLKLTR